MARKEVSPLVMDKPIINPLTGAPTLEFLHLFNLLLKHEFGTNEIANDASTVANAAASASRQIISGGGLTGGGDLSADRTLAVGAGTGIIVNADDVAVDPEYIRDTLAAFAVAGTNMTITHNDGANTLTFDASGGGGGGTTEWSLIDQNGAAISAQTCTMTIASPCVVTLNGHGFTARQQIKFTTTGALPTGLSPDTFYYVNNPTANTFEVSATAGGASINTSGSQSPTHSVEKTTTWSWSTNVSTVSVTGLDSWNELLILAKEITSSASGLRAIRVSTDNGSSYWNTSGDYLIVNTDTGISSAASTIANHSTATTLARSVVCHIRNLKGPIKMAIADSTTGDHFFFTASPLDINAIQVYLGAVGNFTAGNLYVLAK